MAVLAIGVTFRVADLHLQTVLSDSMQPTVSAGDLAVTQAVAIGSVDVGDVIVFYPPASTRAVIHRITSLQDEVITTRGDANSVDDPWHVRLAGPTAYRLVAAVPLLGWLTELRRPALLAAGLLLGLAVALELIKQVRARTSRSRPEPQT